MNQFAPVEIRLAPRLLAHVVIHKSVLHQVKCLLAWLLPPLGEGWDGGWRCKHSFIRTLAMQGRSKDNSKRTCFI
jgi:hypothetical protein